MKNTADWIQLYMGSKTNKGVLIGVVKNSLFIHNGHQEIEEYSKEELGTTVFLYLRKISDLTEQQSDELISKGFAIGRPSGYSFSNEAFLYLLSLSVDLFGIINSGLAKDINKL
jgi:hypothetical protein